MPEDKRPRPTINMTPDFSSQPASRLELPGGSGGPNDRAARQKQAPAGQPSGKVTSARLFSYFLASVLGGLAVAGGGYIALTENIPGFSLADPATRRQIQELREKTADLAKALRAEPRPSPANAYSGSGPEGLNEVRARLDGIVTSARDLDETVQSLSQRVQAVEGKAGDGPSRDAFRADIAAQIAPISQRLATVERELETLTRAQIERQADARTSALTLALTNLKRAIGDGRSFSAELAAVENLSAVKLPVSQLEPYKDAGVPSLAELQRDFANASTKAIQSSYRGKTDSIMGEVFSRAKAAIQVRPSDSSGITVEAILGRMETALKSGNLRTALTEGAALEGPAQEEMQAWLGQAQARVTADEALRKTDQELLASLTKTVGRRP
jgi:hypothetical protein